jgi:hypothetical protein
MNIRLTEEGSNNLIIFSSAALTITSTTFSVFLTFKFLTAFISYPWIYALETSNQ